MNEYDPAEGYVPPGWDEWYGTGNGYYDYVVNENGNPVRYGDREEDYLTDVLAGYATSSIRRAAADDAPFFLLIAPFATPSPDIAAPRHQDIDRQSIRSGKSVSVRVTLGGSRIMKQNNNKN